MAPALRLLPHLVAAIFLLAPAPASAPDPCCLRVTPYHIQALAQRMAQRFQALEYRAQDLRGVFSAFQAVHGNVSHRLRYLEVEHAQLSAIVSRLDSRVYTLEMERRSGYPRRDDYWRRLRRLAEDKSEPLFVPLPLPMETTTVPTPLHTLPHESDMSVAILPLEDPASLEEMFHSSENDTDKDLSNETRSEDFEETTLNTTDPPEVFTTVPTPPNATECGPGGCEGEIELSDDELQEALRDLDALLQSSDRRPDSEPEPSSPPDQEKILLKRALKLALAALERTSEACLTFVNFTADALEELASEA